MYIPKEFKQVAPGVIQRINPTPNTIFEASEKFTNDAIQILKNDLVHYDNLYDYSKHRLPGLNYKYGSCIAIGGGSPKFEFKILDTMFIISYDANADFYSKLDNDFRKIYSIPGMFDIYYIICDLEHPRKFSTPGCITFIHFLEHMFTWDIVCKWISSQEMNSDIIIYGPNFEVAKDENWYHFLPPIHNVFFTIEAITEFATGLGYKVSSMTFSDDMLVWLQFNNL